MKVERDFLNELVLDHEDLNRMESFKIVSVFAVIFAVLLVQVILGTYLYNRCTNPKTDGAVEAEEGRVGKDANADEEASKEGDEEVEEEEEEEEAEEETEEEEEEDAETEGEDED
eukprot:XP_017952435.1 PREDICTED: troponin T, skeletal muscle-like [Xenopus tropicalis]